MILGSVNEDFFLPNIEGVLGPDELTMEEQTEEEKQSSIEGSIIKTALGQSKTKTKQGRPTHQLPKGIISEKDTFKSNVDFKYSCDFCEYKARTIHTLQIHGQMNHLDLVFQCMICDLALKERYTVRKHICEAHSIPQVDINDFLLVKCGICQHTGSEDETTEHITQDHQNLTPFWHVPSQPRYWRLSFKCPFCTEDFSNLPNNRSSYLKTHLQAIHIKSLYKCGQCSYESRTLTFVQSHIHSSHGFPTNLETTESKELTRLHLRHKCYVCGYELADSKKDKLIEHMEVNHKSHLLKTECSNHCDKCNFSSITMKKLKVHKRIMHPDTAYQSRHICSLCEYQTKNKHSFVRHMEKHIGTVYLCNYCKYQFKDKRFLVKHIKYQHKYGNEDKPAINQMTFKCSPCNVQTNRSKYTDHMIQVHAFPLQDKRLSSNNKAKHLVKRYHSNYLHKCPSCNFESNIRFKFISHLHKHLGTRYKCKICEFESEYRIKMISHFRDQHRKEYTDKNTWMLNNVAWKCSTCNLQTDRTDYKIHMTNIHNFNVKDQRFSKAKRSNIPN